MLRTTCAALCLGLLASPAFAGNPKTPVVAAEPVLAPVAPAVDWTGFYIGAILGTGQSDTSLGASGIEVSHDHDTRGLFLGYRHDFGKLVLGGELALDHANVDTLGDTARYHLSAHAGYDLGRVLPYVSLGVAKLELPGGDETGHFFGLGADFKVSERVLVGIEARRTYFADDFLGFAGGDMEGETLMLRMAFRF
ncbi:outer membrane protein [Pseudooceanicola sp. 200-1SW]|uniref:outer membrane protein n=1 Tax=Pseudooceanicola sp. 200-1SW TaxID=3425949 RepID=UPI003D7F737E